MRKHKRTAGHASVRNKDQAPGPSRRTTRFSISLEEAGGCSQGREPLVCSSPKGTKGCSQGREPLVCFEWIGTALKGRHSIRRGDLPMPQSFARLACHVVFSTKGRAALITYAIQESLYAYLGGIVRNLRVPLIERGGTANHVHL